MDRALSGLLRAETQHYLNVADLIAASNAPTSAVRANKGWGVAQFRSAEGYPGKRPYAGTHNFDELEELTKRRAKDVFGAEHANVQPLSGTAANLAAYRALMESGDTLLSLAMKSGGHLSHGHPRHVVRSTYNVVNYDLDPRTELLDYGALDAQVDRHRPAAIIAGFSAYPREVDFARIAGIAQKYAAALIADISHVAGLVAGGVYQNPCESASIVTFSVEKTLRGTRGGVILCGADRASAVDRAVFPGLQSSVGMAGLVSLCSLLHEASTAEFHEYQKQTVESARVLAHELQAAGLRVVTGGTDTHLLLVDLGSVGLTGAEAEQRLSDISILSNRNMIPGDQRTPFVASGLRLGTSTITARGWNSEEVRRLASYMVEALTSETWDAPSIERLKAAVVSLVRVRRAGDTLLDLVDEQL